METFPALLAMCEGNSAVPGEFPAQRPMTQSFDVFFDLRLNNNWVNNREAGDLKRHRTHYDVITMSSKFEYHLPVELGPPPPGPANSDNTHIWNTKEKSSMRDASRLPYFARHMKIFLLEWNEKIFTDMKSIFFFD